MKNIKQELKKLLTCYLDEWIGEGEYDRAPTCNVVDDILDPKVFSHIAVVDREAELPENPHHPNPLREYDHQTTQLLKDTYREGMYQMLIEGWVKEVK